MQIFSTKETLVYTRWRQPPQFSGLLAVLDVPFEDKGVVKSMGAKFDPALRSWVVPKHREYGAFAVLAPEFKISVQRQV